MSADVTITVTEHDSEIRYLVSGTWERATVAERKEADQLFKRVDAMLRGWRGMTEVKGSRKGK